MRGRKKLEIRDFRLERVRAIEAAKFLKIKERDFYRLIEHGFLSLPMPKGRGFLRSLILSFHLMI